MDDISLVGIADVALAKRNNVEARTNLTTTKLAEPSQVKIPMSEEVIERFLEVRSTQNREVITVIAILSPKNKRSKEGRTVYEKKRQKILASATNLIEIDLSRLGESLPILGATQSDYHILVSRSHQRPDADLYSFDLQDTIPVFPVPLRPGENEPVIDLQRLLNEISERARFDLAINYSEPLNPALPSEQEAWVREVLEKNSR